VTPALQSADSPSRPTRTNRPIFGLDLARATAVLLVVASHCDGIFAQWFHRPPIFLIGYGAFYGIELFYVLSGLLIGTLLIGQIDAANLGTTRAHRWFVFMQRRWLRTLPAYYVCLALLALVWAPLLHLGAARTARLTAIFAVMLQNLAWPMVRDDYFDVTWSLAVEEWFYLGFATLLFLLARRRRDTAYLLLAAAFVTAPILGRMAWFAPGASNHQVVFWLDCIGLGAIMAWVASRRPAWYRAAAWLLPVGLALTAFSLEGGLARLHVPPTLQNALNFDLVALAMLLCLPAAARWRDATGPLAALVRWIARLSYCLYLVHLSVLILIDAWRPTLHWSPATCVALSLAGMFAVAMALSALVERPIMARRPR
jgi:peptidoglycan/LPS O-acetylase OafA/YrhL